ncbi:phosphoribosyl-ATP diphosphatase [Macrococcoides bohemicum]|uniref:MazG-like family protein n=1 Tax=Macrococcoides bohemicum TaxID=1903056 RepID=UPI00105A07E4|nr:MazG-like family protein [Macrococcus bohemicus]TDL40559.1 phosphoribosyl-ATP diphosphatase [Macrococcus bohemicus]
MTRLLELIGLIEQWSKDRKLHTADPKKQMKKLGEETGELYGGLSKGNHEVIIDSIGDSFVVLVVLSTQKNINIKEIVKTLESYSNHLDIDVDDVTLALMHKSGMLANAVRHGTPEYTLMMHIQWTMESLLDVADALDVDITECVEFAYNQIKDRKGEMRDGVFVKQEDL